jgi:hypothetical protein
VREMGVGNLRGEKESIERDGEELDGVEVTVDREVGGEEGGATEVVVRERGGERGHLDAVGTMANTEDGLIANEHRTADVGGVWGLDVLWGIDKGLRGGRGGSRRAVKERDLEASGTGESDGNGGNEDWVESKDKEFRSLRPLREVELWKTEFAPNNFEDSKWKLDDEELFGGDVSVVGGNNVESIGSAHYCDVEWHHQSGLGDHEESGERGTKETSAMEEERWKRSEGGGTGDVSTRGDWTRIQARRGDPLPFKSSETKEEDWDYEDPSAKEEGSRDGTREVSCGPDPPVEMCVSGRLAIDEAEEIERESGEERGEKDIADSFLEVDKDSERLEDIGTVQDSRHEVVEMRGRREVFWKESEGGGEVSQPSCCCGWRRCWGGGGKVSLSDQISKQESENQHSKQSCEHDHGIVEDLRSTAVCVRMLILWRELVTREDVPCEDIEIIKNNSITGDLSRETIDFQDDPTILKMRVIGWETVLAIEFVVREIQALEVMSKETVRNWAREMIVWQGKVDQRGERRERVECASESIASKTKDGEVRHGPETGRDVSRDTIAVGELVNEDRVFEWAAMPSTKTIKRKYSELMCGTDRVRELTMETIWSQS